MSTVNAQDNIADFDNEFHTAPALAQAEVTQVEVAPAQDAEYDEYMKKFDAVDAQNVRIEQIITGFNKQQYDQNKLYAAMDCIKELQKQNGLMYELIVEMNNYLGSR